MLSRDLAPLLLITDSLQVRTYVRMYNIAPTYLGDK